MCSPAAGAAVLEGEIGRGAFVIGPSFVLESAAGAAEAKGAEEGFKGGPGFSITLFFRDGNV